jgi:hypothetical protein
MFNATWIRCPRDVDMGIDASAVSRPFRRFRGEIHQLPEEA